MRQIISKVALFLAYALFAGASAYFTSTSLALNMTGGRGIWLIAIMVFLVAIAAGWCLAEFIKQLNSMTPSKGKTLFCFLGFLLFWIFSFATNVHFMVGQKYSFNILTAELSNCRDFLTNETKTTNIQVQNERDDYIKTFEAKMADFKVNFSAELRNTTRGRYGFAQQCIGILKEIETYLYSDTTFLGEPVTDVYKIWRENEDKGLKGTVTPNKMDEIYARFNSRMEIAEHLKKNAIKSHFKSRLNSNETYVALLDKVNFLEKTELPKASRDGSIKAAYLFYNAHQSKLISQMPNEYTESCIIYKNVGSKEKPDLKMKGYKVYPSSNMFNTGSFIRDVLHANLPQDMKILWWLILSLIVDIVSYVFAYLLFK